MMTIFRRNLSVLTFAGLFLATQFLHAKESLSSDVNKVCQLAIDHPGLKTFYHTELPARVPLLVSDLVIGKNLKLAKFGKPVRIVPNDNLRASQPFFRFTKVDVESNSASVEFEYPIEGVVGRLEFTKSKKGHWRVTESKIAEM